MTMGMGKGRNRLFGALILAGFLSVNASDRLRGVRRAARDGGYKSTKYMMENDVRVSASEGPRSNGGTTGKSDQAESAGMPNQTGSPTAFTNSNGRGHSKANIFQKSHRDPTVYQDVEQEPPQSESTDEVYKVSNHVDILPLFENSGKGSKRHKPKISDGMKKLGDLKHDKFHSAHDDDEWLFPPVSSPFPGMTAPPYHQEYSDHKKSTSTDGLKSKSSQRKQSIKKKKNYIHKYKKPPSDQYDMPVVYDKKSKSKDGMKSESRSHKYSYRLPPHYIKPSFPTSSPFPSASNAPSPFTAQPSSSVSPTFPNSTRTVAPSTVARTPSVATVSPSTASALTPTMIPTSSSDTSPNANTTAPTSLPLPQTAAPTQQPAPAVTVSPGATVAPTTPLDPQPGIDFDGCFQDLATADRDGNGIINLDEYLGFVQEYGKRKCYEADALTLEQRAAFNSLACLCRSQEGADASCCIGENAGIPIAGALNPTLTTTCSVTDGTIDSSCPTPSFPTATTLPTPLASTPPLVTTVEPTTTVTDPPVVEPTTISPTNSPSAGLSPVPTLPPSELSDPAATVSPTVADIPTLPPSELSDVVTTASPTIAEPDTIIPTDPPVAAPPAVPTLPPTVLVPTDPPFAAPTTGPTLPPTVLRTTVVTASPTVPETTEPTITPPTLATVPPNPDDSPTDPPGSPVLPSVEIPENLEPCDDDPKCKVLQSAIFDFVPLENRVNIGIVGTCENWAREWMRSDPIFNAGLAADRTRQRYALAVTYCKTQGDNWADKQQFLAPIDECEWFTVVTEDTCDNDGMIEILRLPENNMVGTMPQELSMMSSLLEIQLEGNSLQGTVPEDFATMSNLKSLDLSSNNLMGPMPEFVWDLQPLEVLDLSNNGLTGFIPAILMTENLQILSLSNNNFSGEIPVLFGLLNWNILHLDNNQFSGQIPSDLSSPNMQELLLHNNQLTGNFPADDFVSAEEFAELLTMVMIHGNQLTGDLNPMCALMENGLLETLVADLDEVVCDCCQAAP